MSLNDPLSNALSLILNAERIGKRECMIKPMNKIVKQALKIMNDEKYIGTFEEKKDGRGNVLVVNLLGNINKCGCVKPRYNIKKSDFEKFEKSYLPSRNFGTLIISTSQGMMTHTDAKKKGVGGKLLAYFY